MTGCSAIIKEYMIIFFSSIFPFAAEFHVHIENVHSNGPSGNTPRVILRGFGSTVLQRGACVKGSPA